MVIGSFLVVRIAAVVFELTGLEWTMAKFQALSCFTATGYTTRESELVARDPRRRRIASILMILGHAGLITLIATFANSLSRHETESTLAPVIRLAVIMTVVYVSYLVFIRTRLAGKIDNLLRRHASKRQGAEEVPYRQLIVATPGYEISSVKVSEKDAITNKILGDSDLGSHDIIVLALERQEGSIVLPLPETKVLPGDNLVCFGKVGDVEKQICGA